jgi:uncharacterized protein YbbC (DUF1343 family)
MTPGRVTFHTVSLEAEAGALLRSGRIGLLCNQAAWHPDTGEYLFETLARLGGLKRIFVPEHGLFGELQDQVPLDGAYGRSVLGDCEIVSLYGAGEESRSPRVDILSDLDALVVELQDVGCRYFTFLSTLYHIFKTLRQSGTALPVYMLDRKNPAGRAVEGSPLREGYGSFIGIEGIPHRYGLTIGEMAHYLYASLGADFPLKIFSAETAGSLAPWVIPPSPNFAGPLTARLYSGQCLWEGTTVSEGRGTTRPFEVFGAPYMECLVDYNRRGGYVNWNDSKHPLADPGVLLRWHRFIPVFHKYRDECCFGFHLIPRPGRAYHALGHALRLIRFIAENCEGFSFRPGTYETGNGKTAIEILTGDPFLLEYLWGTLSWEEVRQYMQTEERDWINRVRPYLFYGDPLFPAWNFP